MAYFPNGTSGEMYEEKWCCQCRHYEPQCPIMDLHLFYNYDFVNDKEHPAKIMLDTLIPMKGLYADKCSMFIDKL